MENKKLKIFTWHIHGSYLYYLSQCNCQFIIPVKESNEEGYYGKIGMLKNIGNITEVPAEKVPNTDFDIIMFQTPKNYYFDQYQLLSKKQRALPYIYLEHNTPNTHATNSRHYVDNPRVTVVHVTDYNKLMWDNGNVPTVVIPHGVKLAENIRYTGKFEKGIVIINNIKSRSRRLGLDIFEYVKQIVPLDIIGMESEEVEGIGEIEHGYLAEYIKDYRFFFNPVRYTSLPLALCEAMMIGLPIVALATTEVAVTVVSGEEGYISTKVSWLVEKMKLLLSDVTLAKSLSRKAQRSAREKFSIKRFCDDWEKLFNQVASKDKPIEKQPYWNWGKLPDTQRLENHYE